MIPDGEKLIADHLRDDSAVSAIVARRVVGKTPPSIGEPWVRLTQLDAREPNGHRSDYFIRFYVQLDCYAGASGGQPEATSLGRAVRAGLVGLPSAEHAAVVTGVDITSHARVPDTSLDPDRERVIITAYVWMHP